MQNAVHAIIVCHLPDWERLSRSLASLAPQVAYLVIVDNGGQAARLQALADRLAPGKARVLEQDGNIGLAAAQNCGIREARAGGASHVLLLDDDSIPASDMVERLLGAVEAAALAGEKVAAAGPVFEDDRTSTGSYFVRVGTLRLRRLRCGAGQAAAMRCDLLISSGMLIPSDALRAIGGMDESLFIDHVDTDWCLRALRLGYGMLGVCGARMLHRLGDREVRVTAERRILAHSPVRYYYFFRNSVLLYARRYPSLRWKLADGLRLAGLFVGIAARVSPRRRNLGAAVSGLMDGLRGRSGPAAKEHWWMPG